MAVEIIFPRVDMDMASGRVSRWLVAEGHPVSKGEPLFEIETDKAAMEIDAPASGTLRGITPADGAEVKVGTAVGWIVGEGEAWQPNDALPVTAPAALPVTAPAALPVTAPAALPVTAPAALPVTAPAALPVTAPTALPVTAPTALPVTAPAAIAARETPSTAPPEAELAALRATPLARREAARLGLDLRAIQGSGPHGRVVAADIQCMTPPSIQPTQPAARTATRPLYRQWLGAEHGTPLLFLHGFGSDQSSWRGVWGALAGAHRILAIDLPGHGRSGSEGPVSLAALVDAVRTVLEEEAVSSLHLVGHSLGGAVALGLAEAGVVQLCSLCLIAPAGLGPEINGDFLDGLLRAERPQSLAPWLRRLFVDPELVTSAFIEASLRRRADSRRMAYQRALLDAVFPDGTQAIALDHVLRRLTVPSKVIWGAQDRIIPIRHAARLPTLVALHRLECGHMPQLEDPRSVAILIGQLAASG